jgi:hypothetical protein
LRASASRPTSEDVLADLPGERVLVHPILCFIDGHFPMLRPPVVNGVPALSPKATARRLGQDGPIAPTRITEVAAHIGVRLHPSHDAEPNNRARAA